ncbi:MAG: heme NO-binding domain-containing protein [Halieaceae bacterium]|nr:heme NO-binding domain-containing protein [Halieaceae bacterium]
MIHKVLHDLLLELGGDDLVRRISRRAGVELADIRIVDYQSDEEFRALLAIVLEESGLDRSAMMQSYADHFLAYAEGLFPQFFAMSENTRAFLIRQPRIHSTLGAGLRSDRDRLEVRNKFTVIECDDGTLEVEYRSVAALCDLYRTLARSLAARYEEQVFVSVMNCGAGSGCRLKLMFTPPEATVELVRCTWSPAS